MNCSSPPFLAHMRRDVRIPSACVFIEVTYGSVPQFWMHVGSEADFSAKWDNPSRCVEPSVVSECAKISELKQREWSCLVGLLKRAVEREGE